MQDWCWEVKTRKRVSQVNPGIEDTIPLLGSICVAGPRMLGMFHESSIEVLGWKTRTVILKKSRMYTSPAVFGIAQFRIQPTFFFWWRQAWIRPQNVEVMLQDGCGEGRKTATERRRLWCKIDVGRFEERERVSQVYSRSEAMLPLPLQPCVAGPRMLVMFLMLLVRVHGRREVTWVLHSSATWSWFVVMML